MQRLILCLKPGPLCTKICGVRRRFTGRAPAHPARCCVHVKGERVAFIRPICPPPQPLFTLTCDVKSIQVQRPPSNRQDPSPDVAYVIHAYSLTCRFCFLFITSSFLRVPSRTCYGPHVLTSRSSSKKQLRILLVCKVSGHQWSLLVVTVLLNSGTLEVLHNCTCSCSLSLC